MQRQPLVRLHEVVPRDYWEFPREFSVVPRDFPRLCVRAKHSSVSILARMWQSVLYRFESNANWIAFDTIWVQFLSKFHIKGKCKCKFACKALQFKASNCEASHFCKALHAYLQSFALIFAFKLYQRLFNLHSTHPDKVHILAKIDTEVCCARSHSLGKFPGYLLVDRPVEALQFLDHIGPWEEEGTKFPPPPNWVRPELWRPQKGPRLSIAQLRLKDNWNWGCLYTFFRTL